MLKPRWLACTGWGKGMTVDDLIRLLCDVSDELGPNTRVMVHGSMHGTPSELQRFTIQPPTSDPMFYPLGAAPMMIRSVSAFMEVVLEP